MALAELERLIERLENSPDDESRQEILRALVPFLEFHREVLQRLLQILRDSGHTHLIQMLLRDPLLESALRGYELVPEQTPSDTVSGLPSAGVPSPGGNWVPIEQLAIRAPGGQSGKWVPLVHKFELQKSPFVKVPFFDSEVLVCATQGRVFAFRNSCPAGNASLEQSSLEGFFLICPCHGYHFDLRSGWCREVHSLKLEALPVMMNDTVVKIAL